MFPHVKYLSKNIALTCLEQMHIVYCDEGAGPAVKHAPASPAGRPHLLKGRRVRLWEEPFRHPDCTAFSDGRRREIL